MDVLLILLLTLLSGLFSMTEIAVVSSRRVRLEAMASDGDHGARAALWLQDNPTLFFSTIQMGNTTVALLNGIVGEGAFGDGLAAALQGVGLPAGWAHALATTAVVVAVTYVTIVIGELVAKRIGQTAPEAIARWMARPLLALAKVAKPAVALLALSTNALLRLLGIPPLPRHEVTVEEIQAQLAHGVRSGVIERGEHRMVGNVLALDDRQLGSLMVPRAEIVWLDAERPLGEVLINARHGGHSWYPVCRGGLDDVLGVIHLSRLIALDEKGGREHDWVRDVQPAVFVPETLSGLDLLEQFRARAMRMVFVVDEYGEVQGLLTPLDLLEAITGELSSDEPHDAWATPQPDGSWLLDGSMPAHELKSRLDIGALPDEERDLYGTLAGLMQTVAGRLLKPGDAVAVEGWRLTVLSMQGRRIDRVRAERLQAPDAPPVPPPDPDAQTASL
ncbi:Magnesium and cobalt efflux protein CorC [Tepidimonas thermarum]|uniref:Magnesium and cobalt efflux protein CorC n=1 Tax=Tepidimonas thermarum TaxID=335431 RepID=A0A554X251_9BURK|nr:hemolysin family protein [Tepidimonas thermarum]TSE29929.1 Magnesium and cobalt efflux protein CorC [Tepidimonas thermarum]